MALAQLLVVPLTIQQPVLRARIACTSITHVLLGQNAVTIIRLLIVESVRIWEDNARQVTTVFITSQM